MTIKKASWGDSKMKNERLLSNFAIKRTRVQGVFKVDCFTFSSEELHLLSCQTTEARKKL